MSRASDRHATKVAALVDSICPLLTVHPNNVIAAALADLLALFLAGHYVPGDAEATAELRADTLADLCVLVGHLIPINECLTRLDS